MACTGLLAMNLEQWRWLPDEHVALAQKIPVRIVYFTAWPKAGGGFETCSDVDGHDAKQAQN
jgi:murein L,D-transpeptidase YcbB/YkuD